MARKLKGRAQPGKGLKAKLAAHRAAEKVQKPAPVVGAADRGPKKRSANRDVTFVPFSPDDRLLLVGEGDFTFAKSIVESGMVAPENLVATSYDSLQDLQRKYADNVDHVLEYLRAEDRQVAVHHEVDAQDLIKSLKLSEKHPAKSRAALNNIDVNLVMFNFPHTGSGIKDMDRNIKAHQELMVNFFKSCRDFLQLVDKIQHAGVDAYLARDPSRDPEAPRKIVLSLFEGEPYDSWGVKRIAKSFGYKVERSGNFNWRAFKSYHHRRTNGTLKDTTTPAAHRRARIYVFEPVKPDQDSKKRAHKDSDDDE